MCGVNGIFVYGDAAGPVDVAELLRTRDAMAARGPDGAGAWISPDRRAALAHRRLSIIDLSDAGAQPMTSRDGNLTVSFNGAIYNYRALRRSLEAGGHVFRSRSDTEILLHLYAAKGAAMVRDLRGMFAFAIWDEARRRLFVARDPYGIKPLYCADDGRTFRFASQVKALVCGGAISRDPEPAGLVGFDLWGSVPEPFTVYRAIRALPAGCAATVDRRGVSDPERYHSIAAVYCDAERAPAPALSPGDRQAAIRDALIDSVRDHLTSDTPVGAFLSAGVDSAALVGLMRDAGQDNIETLTLTFAESEVRDEEAPLAERVAHFYGARHTTRVVTRSEFERDLPSILDAMDQPSIDGVNIWFAAKAAREMGLKAMVSGLGGDELFGGYPSFRDLPRWMRRFAVASRAPFFGRLARKALRPSILACFGVSPKAAGVLEYGGAFPGAYLLRRGLFMPWELDALRDPDLARAGLATLRPLASIEAAMTPTPDGDFAKVASLESSLYLRNQLLRDADWAGMAHGVEIRAPLADAALLARMAPHARHIGAAGCGKMALAKAPAAAAPDAILRRPKTGFCVPIGAWLAEASGHRPISRGLAARQWSRRVLAGMSL